MCPQPAQHDRPLWPSAYLLLARVLSWLALLARSDTAKDDRPPLRPEQPAPSGVDVKDLRPLRGRPFGSIPDPDPNAKNDIVQQQSSPAAGVHRAIEGRRWPTSARFPPRHFAAADPRPRTANDSVCAIMGVALLCLHEEEHVS
jgi:hypothetical protein